MRGTETSSSAIRALQRNLADRMREAVVSCPHVIDRDEVRLLFDDRAPGHNAYNQLDRRIARVLADWLEEAVRTGLVEAGAFEQASSVREDVRP